MTTCGSWPDEHGRSPDQFSQIGKDSSMPDTTTKDHVGIVSRLLSDWRKPPRRQTLQAELVVDAPSRRIQGFGSITQAVSSCHVLPARQLQPTADAPAGTDTACCAPYRLPARRTIVVQLAAVPSHSTALISEPQRCFTPELGHTIDCDHPYAADLTTAAIPRSDLLT